MAPRTHPLIDHYKLLARYNRWFNERLFAACEALPDEERRRDRGAFFGSVHGSLNHILWADRLWLRRFAAQGVVFPALTDALLHLPGDAVHETILHEDWHGLVSARVELDAAIERWVSDMPDDFAQQPMRYTNMAGIPREHPAWQALAHFFNHQTHHRGQVTTLLSQAGIDVGVTDMIVLAQAPSAVSGTPGEVD